MVEKQPGWLKKQLDEVEEDVKNWPTWMKEDAKENSGYGKNLDSSSHQDQNVKNNC